MPKHAGPVQILASLSVGLWEPGLHNSCTHAPKQGGFPQTQGISPEHKLLIQNNSVWNREFAKPL